jgi:hypothetical protein
VSTPITICPLLFDDVARPVAICSNTSASWSPRKIEMMAGGASLAPSRWSLVAEATEARRSPAYLCTARITAAQNTRNCAFSCGVSPGTSRLPSSALPREKLTCLPDPLTPSNGFSWNRHSIPCFFAMAFSVVMSSCWWSAATFARSNIGAISNCPGATSLCRVFAGMPSLNSSRSASIMKPRTRSGMAPK